MRELGNGQMSKPKGNYTGDRLQLVKREQIVNSLSHGESICSIARTLKVARETVRLVREQEYAEISRRKMLIRDSAARLAVDGFDRLNEEMQAGKIKGSLLMTVTGMATDKVVALSNDALQVNINHAIEPGKRLWEKFNALTDQLNAKVIEAGACHVVQSTLIEAPAVSNADAASDSGAETHLVGEKESPQKGLPPTHRS